MDAVLNTTSAVVSAISAFLPPQAVLSYTFVVVALIYLMAPNPVALTKPRVNVRAVRKANWKSVGWEKKIKPMRTGKKYTVIGSGFVGKRIIHSLLLRGETNITAFDLDPQACEAFKNEPSVKFVQGNVCVYENVVKAVEGADVVFSTFAILRFMDRFDSQAALSFKINVGGTENVIKACSTSGVKLLIQTSTSNVAVSQDQISFHMDEKVDYVTRQNSPNHYGWTKAIAEQLVLKADGLNGMRTAAIRPCSSVFGADDKLLMEVMLNLGRTTLPPNGGSTVNDYVYVLNVVYGHFLLEQALWNRPDDGIAGEAFCVSNNCPMRLIDVCGLLNVLKPGGVTIIPMPDRLLRLLSVGIELCSYFGYRVPGLLGNFTKTTCDLLDMNHVFSSRKAHERLGY